MWYNELAYVIMQFPAIPAYAGRTLQEKRNRYKIEKERIYNAV